MNFLQAFRAVFESGLALAQQSVLLVMIDHLPDCRPSAARIAARAKVSEREVFRVFKELEAVGVVEVLRSPGRPSSYRIDLEKLPSQENTPDARSPLTYGHPCPTVITPLTQGHGTPDVRSPKGNKEGSKEGSGALSPNSNPSKAEKPKPPKSAKPRRGTLSHFVPDDFAPLDGHRAKATELGVDLGRELEAFRAYEFKTAKSDWDRAFTNWLTRAAEYAGKGAPGSGPRPTVAADAGLKVIRTLGDLRR